MAGNTKSPVINAYWMDRRIEGVLSVEVEDHDQLIDKATIVLEDGGRLAPTACYPEEKVVIEMGWDGQSAVLFEGLVVEGGGEHVQSGSQAKMVAYDYSVRMHRTRVNHKIAKGAKLSAVVKEIASKPEYKFKAEDIHIDLDDDPEFKRDMSEPNTTDLQFLQKLALQFQCRTFVEYNAPKGGSGERPLPVLFQVSQQDPARRRRRDALLLPRRSPVGRFPLSARCLRWRRREAR